ncbi:MAG: nitrate/nitrite transporter NrtS [Pseudomonadota bacterium]
MAEQSNQTPFLTLAMQPGVVRRAAKISLIVGTILAIINHLPAALSGQLSMLSAVQIVITYAVPYSVATWSAVQTIRDAATPLPRT